MNPHSAWRQLRQKLDATDAVRNFAGNCQLIRIEDNTFHLETNQAFTKGQGMKLAQAINLTLGVPAAVAIRRLPLGMAQRFYSDNTRKSA